MTLPLYDIDAHEERAQRRFMRRLLVAGAFIFVSLAGVTLWV